MTSVSRSDNRDRRLTVVGVGAVAELSPGIVSPAVGPITGGEATGEEPVEGGAHRLEVQPARDRGRRQAVDVDSAVAQPAGVVVAPAVRQACRSHAASGFDSRAHTLELVPA